MSLSVRFLGTSASRPTVERNVSSIAVIREGETLLFDCGEGTQRQMMRYGVRSPSTTCSSRTSTATTSSA